MLGDRFRRCLRREQPADPQMLRGPLALGDERVSRLQDAIVDEPICVQRALHQFLTDGRRQSRVDLPLRTPEDDRQHRGLGAVSETGQLLQCLVSLSLQARQLTDHEVDHVVGVSLGVNALEIPGPACSSMIEDEHAFVSERRNELIGEERIAGRLFMY